MFTGLIETIGTVRSITPQGDGVRLMINADGLRHSPERGASIAVNGACLTVTEITGTTLSFDAVKETISRTALQTLRPGSRVNLESAMRLGQPLDGHLVLGHVDAVGTLLGREMLRGSAVLRFSLPEHIGPLVAEKGSVAVNGISLTVVEAQRAAFTVSIIPETMACTTLPELREGDGVNLEADVLARYVARLHAWNQGGLTEEKLRALGFA